MGESVPALFLRNPLTGGIGYAQENAAYGSTAAASSIMEAILASTYLLRFLATIFTGATIAAAEFFFGGR